MIACFFIKVGTCAPAPKRRLGACGTRKGRVCYEQLRGARPRRRRQAHSHPKYGSKPGPLPWNFLSPSSVHESPAPASPLRNTTEPVAFSVSSPPPPCGCEANQHKKGRVSKTGRSEHRYFSPFPDILRPFSRLARSRACLFHRALPLWLGPGHQASGHAQKRCECGIPI